MNITDDELVDLIHLVASKYSIEQTAKGLDVAADQQFTAGYLACLSILVTYMQMVTKTHQTVRTIEKIH